jgi:fructose 1,6-bisphosphatase
VIREWKRKNIENYLLVPDAWKMAVLDALNKTDIDLFDQVYWDVITTFFEQQGLVLPKHSTWQTVKANIFEVVDGKKILFEDPASLFHQLRSLKGLLVNRERVARNMRQEMIHQDIVDFFDLLAKKVASRAI